MRIGIVGTLDSGKEIILDYLKKEAIKTESLNEPKNEKDSREFLIVFKQIPIKIRVFTTNNIDGIIYDRQKIKTLDVIILALNLHDLNSMNEYSKDDYEKFNDYFLFQGFSILAGIKKKLPSAPQISKEEIINKTKELNILYCFEIQNENNDLREFYEKILNDFIFKFQYSSPELFDRAAEYGKHLIKKYNLQN